MTASSAGMPPVFVYRAKTDTVDEFVTKGMPLGAFDAYPYQTVEAKLETGDTILLMSDGLPELFNKNNDQFEYSQVSEILAESGKKSSTDIVRELFKAADTWRNGKEQNDDISFIVIKILDEKGEN